MNLGIVNYGSMALGLCGDIVKVSSLTRMESSRTASRARSARRTLFEREFEAFSFSRRVVLHHVATLGGSKSWRR